MKNLVLLFILVFSSYLTIAQTTLTPEMEKEMVGKLTESIDIQYGDIDLSDQQKEKIIELHLYNMVKFMPGMSDNPPMTKEEGMKFRKDNVQKLAAIFTEKQTAQMESAKMALNDLKKEQRKFHQENFEAIRKQREWEHSYYNSEIIEVIQKQRLKLDKLMSQEDRAEVSRIKFDLNKNDEDAMNLYTLMKEQYPNDEDNKKVAKLVNESSEQAKLTEEWGKIMDRRKILVEKYEKEINLLMDEIKDEREVWRTTIQDSYDVLYKDAPMRKHNETDFYSSPRYYKDVYNDKEYHKKFIMMEPAFDELDNLYFRN